LASNSKQAARSKLTENSQQNIEEIDVPYNQGKAFISNILEQAY